MVSDRIELTTLDSEVTRSICIDQCGAKCCNFAINDFSVKLSPEDYRKLSDNDLDEFVTFQRDEAGTPQLVNKLDGTCIFLHPSKQCSIYAIRPVSCRIYPFKADNTCIPDWCLLYHNTSDQLKKEQRQKSYKAYDPKKEGNAYRNYNKWKAEGDIFITEQMKQQATFDGSNEYWIVFLSPLANKKTIRSKLKQIKKKFSDKEWYIYSIRVYNENAEFLFQANGVVRDNYKIEVPFIDHFPPNPKDVLYLLQETEHNAKYQKHLIAGVDLSENVYDSLLDRFV